MNIIEKNFYNRDTLEVARDLLGKKLTRIIDGEVLSGIIIETEAYLSNDPACHAFRGKTERNKALFGEVGHAYVYFTYGMHYCFNIVSRDIKSSAYGGTLIRGILPIRGLDYMAEISDKEKVELLDGPAKITKALKINHELNGIDITTFNGKLFIEKGANISDSCVDITPRIGISQAIDKLYRFVVKKECYKSILELNQDL